jgi:hypothetical protein
MLREQPHRLVAVRRSEDLVSRCASNLAHQGSNRLLVLGQKHALGGVSLHRALGTLDPGRARLRPRGEDDPKVDPWPRLEVTEIPPPDCLTMP